MSYCTIGRQKRKNTRRIWAVVMGIQPKHTSEYSCCGFVSSGRPVEMAQDATGLS